jgi:hypothetical protein
MSAKHRQGPKRLVLENHDPADLSPRRADCGCFRRYPCGPDQPLPNPADKIRVLYNAYDLQHLSAQAAGELDSTFQAIFTTRR